MGASYVQVAQEAIAEFGIENLPSGWSERTACQDVHRELAKARATLAESAADVKDIELARLDELYSRIYPVALGTDTLPPDVRAVDRVLRIMERRAKMIGIDVPTDLDREIAAILAALAGIRQTEIAGETEAGDSEADESS